jgi:hypothetical protein
VGDVVARIDTDGAGKKPKRDAKRRRAGRPQPECGTCAGSAARDQAGGEAPAADASESGRPSSSKRTTSTRARSRSGRGAVDQGRRGRSPRGEGTGETKRSEPNEPAPPK